MVTITMTGHTVNVSIAPDMPLCLVPAVKEVIQCQIHKLWGQRIEAGTASYLQGEISREVDNLLTYHTHRDGYPVLTNILRKLNFKSVP
jgi:hypothetical protein